MLEMVYIEPATSGYLVQIITGMLIGLIPLGLMIFFVVWTVIKIKKLQRQNTELERKIQQLNSTYSNVPPTK